MVIIIIVIIAVIVWAEGFGILLLKTSTFSTQKENVVTQSEGMSKDN